MVAEKLKHTHTHTHTHTTHTHTHTRDNYCNPGGTCSPKVNNYVNLQYKRCHPVMQIISPHKNGTPRLLLTTCTVPRTIYVIIDGLPGPTIMIWTVPRCNGQSARGSPVLPWIVYSACFSEHHCSHAGVTNVYCHVLSLPDRLFCDGPPIIILIEPAYKFARMIVGFVKSI